jgi:hypothetical protein
MNRRVILEGMCHVIHDGYLAMILASSAAGLAGFQLAATGRFTQRS